MRWKMRKGLSILICLALAAVMLVSCKKSPEEPADQTPEEPTEQTVPETSNGAQSNTGETDPTPDDNTLKSTDDSNSNGTSQAAGDMVWVTVNTDWMSVDIPAEWSWADTNDPPGDINIFSDDASIRMFVGYVIAGNPEVYLTENPSQPFTFDSGTVGYMLESDESIIWLNPDMFIGSGVCFYLDNGRASYNNNEDIILRIAKSYRSN